MILIAPAPGTRLAGLGFNYAPIRLLSAPEQRLFAALERVTDATQVRLVCKPRIADFVEAEHRRGAFQKISQKHVDFLFCRANDWTPMLAVELDDSSHSHTDRKTRDAFVNNLFAHLGIPLLRLNISDVDRLETLVTKLTAGWRARCDRLLRNEVREE